MSTTTMTQATTTLAERELRAASEELASLSTASSPSRLERALERVEAARHAMALAA